MKQYRISGMSCASCQARVEKAVSKVPGVTSCSVNLIMNTLGVEGSASDKDIIKAVKNAGYGVVKENDDEAAKTGLGRRLLFSLLILPFLLYLSMGHMIFNWPIPGFLQDNPAYYALTMMVFSLAVLIINNKFFVSGIKACLHLSPNMDTLVSLGSGVSFIRSVWMTVDIFLRVSEGNLREAFTLTDNLYYDSAAMILTLITVGKMLENRSKGRTTNALKNLMKLTPLTATKLVDGKEETVKTEDLKQGDMFAVHPGESIPVDGIVRKGFTAVNEAMLTGESIPVDKNEGDTVYCGTINHSGYIECEATNTGNDTSVSKIIKLVNDAQITKAPIARIADEVSKFFVPAVLLIALLVLIIWLLCGQNFDYALERAVSVLVFSCPCALGLATPVAIMVGNGVGATHGILFKTAEMLEQTGKADIVVFDKTGTITKGEPTVSKAEPEKDFTENDLLQLALNVEKGSEHPLAKAIVAEAENRGLGSEPVDKFVSFSGKGVSCELNGRKIMAGNYTFIRESLRAENTLSKFANEDIPDGCTAVYFTLDGKSAGRILLSDEIRPEASKSVEELDKMGIATVLLTGDNVKTAEAKAGEAGIKYFIAEVLPWEKRDVIAGLKEVGKVAMVGDGVNDAPALAEADIGIAIGAGTDIAIDAAGVVLMNNRVNDVPAAIRLSKATLRNIKGNLFWALIYNVLGIPLAAGAFTHILGFGLNPMICAAAMSLSSFCVVTNALSLNLVDIYKDKGKRKNGKNIDKKENRKDNTDDKGNKDNSGTGKTKKNDLTDYKINKKIEEIINAKKERIIMEKTMKIEGMMCVHCEARVKKVLEGIDGVTAAVVSHEAGEAKVTMNKDIDDEILKTAVQNEGYSVPAVSK